MSRDSSFNGSDGYEHPEPYPEQLEDRLEELSVLHAEREAAAEAEYIAALGENHAEPAAEPEPPVRQEVVIEAGLVRQLWGLCINAVKVVSARLGAGGSTSAAVSPAECNPPVVVPLAASRPQAAGSHNSAAASSYLLPLPQPLDPTLELPAPPASPQYIGRTLLDHRPAEDSRNRYYVVWSVPGHPALAGLHIGVDTHAYYGLRSFFPEGCYKTGNGVAFCRAYSPAHAEQLYQQSASRYGCPKPARWFRWN